MPSHAKRVTEATGSAATHTESRLARRSGWLRAAVLGANDGIVSTASLLVGVAMAGTDPSDVVLTGVAALVAGSMSMAAGEYVSVHSQADTERAELSREAAELEQDPAGERAQLAAIYVSRGLQPALAAQVAEQLTRYDALGAHARDELGLSGSRRARPLQAALASAGSFALGASLPLAVAVLLPARGQVLWIATTSLMFLLLLGALAAGVGGAKLRVGAIRVGFWGALAMLTTAGVGTLFGAVL